MLCDRQRLSYLFAEPVHHWRGEGKMALSFKGVKMRSGRHSGVILAALMLVAAALVPPARAEDPLLEEAAGFFGQILFLEGLHSF